MFNQRELEKLNNPFYPFHTSEFSKQYMKDNKNYIDPMMLVAGWFFIVIGSVTYTVIKS